MGCNLNIDEMPAGREMDALIALTVYGLDTEVFADALGESLYIVDRHATRLGPGSTSATVFGCSWTKARNQAGDIVEFYGRLCPLWSSGHDAVWDLMKLKRIVVWPWGGGWSAAAVDMVHDDTYMAFGPIPKTLATADTPHLAVCRAVLKASKPQTEEYGALAAHKRP